MDTGILTQVKSVHHLTQNQNIVDYNMEEEYYYNYLYDKKSVQSMKSCFYSLVGIILLVILSLFFSGCKSIQYVPVEKVITEYKTNTVHDSVYLEVLKHDSVVIEKLGDTVYINKWHTQYKDRWREKFKTDTFIKVDSIQVPYPVERKLTKWENLKMDAGGIAIGTCIAFVLIVIIYFLIRAYRKT
jgi:hypothetical protein